MTESARNAFGYPIPQTSILSVSHNNRYVKVENVPDLTRDVPVYNLFEECVGGSSFLVVLLSCCIVCCVGLEAEDS